MKLSRIPRRLTALVAASLLIACGDDGGPATTPDVTGFYVVTYDFTYVTTGAMFDFSCPGAIDITNQTDDGVISGTYSLTPQAECDADPQEGTIAGTIETDGTITISNLLVANFGLSLGGACELLDGSVPVVGTVSGDLLSAQATTALECALSTGTLTKFSMTLQVTGARQSR